MIAPKELEHMARRFYAAEQGDARVVLLARDGLRLLEDRLELSTALAYAEEQLAVGVTELQRAWEEKAQADAGARLAIAASGTMSVELAAARLTVGKLGAELERAARRLASYRVRT